MRLLLLLSIMAAMPPMTRAFVATPTTKSIPQTTSSTTLYYRDDVPPIGSSPYWETPNDFQQFLTQCSIQSFMFLLRSLRDDHTMQWLHDFTDPVMMQQQQQQHNVTIATTTTNKPASAKVSLAEAAQSALLNTEKALTEGIITKPDTEVSSSSKTTLPTNKKEKKSAMKEKKKKSAKSKKVIANNHKKKRTVFQPSTALLSMLKDRAAVKSAFSHYTVGMYLATPKREERPVSNTDSTSAPIVSNTGISSLYSSVPTRQSPPAAMKKSFSPFAGKKHKPVPPTPFSSGPFSGADKKHKPVPTSPFSSGPSFTGANTASLTASLYGAPAAKPEPQKEDSTKETETNKKVDSTSSSSNNNDDGYKTFPKSNPVALKYHGLAILNRTRFPTWESYFEQLLEQPKESFLVESYHANIPTYEMDIDPASLVRRMLSVRMQIAQEFEHDLEVIAQMGGLTLKSYQKMLREIREQRAEEELQQQKDQLEKQMPKSMEDAISHNNGASATDDVENGKPTNKKAPKPTVQRANLLFLESAVVANGASADYAPSPLRKSNFDLLCLLATQEAIHRVLNDPSRQARKSPEHGSNQFLQDFYVTRLLSHFSGDQKYGRSDDFLEELLECPPRMITVNTGEDGNNKGDDSNADELTKDLTYLVDPVKVAETILNEREKVALEWKQQLEEQTKEDHMALQKMILAKVMGGTIDECQIVDSEGQDLEDEFDSCFE